MKRDEIISLIEGIPKTPSNEEILNIPIDEIVLLSTRAINVLSQAGITKLSDLLLINPRKLYTVRNIGKKTICEIREAIEALLPLATIANIEKLTPKKDLLPMDIKRDNRSANEAETLKEESCVQLKKATFEESIKARFDEKLLNMPIEELDLTERSFSGLKRADCKTIRDIVDFGLDTLQRKKVKNMGRKSIANIKNAILTIETQAQSIKEISFSEAIENILAFLSSKHVKIIKARYGYDEKKHTLEEIGNEVGVTRERVRQIIKSVIRRIRHYKKKVLQGLIEHIEEQLLRYKGIISINDLTKDKYFSSGTHKQLRFLINLFVELYPERYRFINKYFLTSIDDEEIKLLHSKIREVASKCQFPTNEETLIENIKSSVGPISEDYLAYHLLYKERIVISKGKVLSPGRLSVPERVKLLLKDIDKPMHFTEIAKLYRNYFRDAKTKPMDLERAIHSRIADSKDFIIVGPGSFMLRDKFRTPDNIGEIVNVCKSILRSLQNISDTKHLITELTKGNIDVGALNPYSLKPILLEYPGFISYRKFEIGLQELANKCQRMPLSDLIYKVLFTTTKPMHTKQIWKEILKQRGFPEYAISQELVDDPRFIRIAPATYTVSENISRYEEKREIIVDFTKEWINLKRNAISAFFISEVLKETSEFEDLSLGLVENVLATSPEFIRLPNGFYDLAHKENNKIMCKTEQ